MTEVLALIPARGGSKSIPRKNIIDFAGYPLIAFSIAAGLAAETVTRVIVSTDDDEIAAISRNFGAEVPFIRPAEHSQDQTPDLPVFQHALEWLAENESYNTYINLSSIYAILDEKEKSLKYLSEAMKQDYNVGMFTFTVVNPFFDVLRDEPEFKAFVQQGLDKQAANIEKFNEMKKSGEIDL